MRWLKVTRAPTRNMELILHGLKSILKVVAQIARSAIISILYVEFLFLFLFLFLWLMRIIFRANSLSWRTFKADKNWAENFQFLNKLIFEG